MGKPRTVNKWNTLTVISVISVVLNALMALPLVSTWGYGGWRWWNAQSVKIVPITIRGSEQHWVDDDHFWCFVPTGSIEPAVISARHTPGIAWVDVMATPRADSEKGRGLGVIVRFPNKLTDSQLRADFSVDIAQFGIDPDHVSPQPVPRYREFAIEAPR